jgi:hypothetical protein
LRPEVWKNSSTAFSSNEGELARSITTCAPATASLTPSPVMVLTPELGEAATTSWPRWRRNGDGVHGLPSVVDDCPPSNGFECKAKHRRTRTLQRWRKIFLTSRHLNFSEDRLRDKRKSR